MDPRQSDSLMKKLISLEQDLLRWDTCVLIDSSTTQCVESNLSLNHNGLLGECIQGPKNVVHNAHG